MKNENCIFCKIVKKELPASIVFEDEISIAFLDIKPVNDGHLLLIPKDHHPYLTDTPDELLKELSVRTKFLMTALKKALNPELVVLSVVGEEIPHFHIKLIPRFKNDGIGGFWPTKEYESAEKMLEIKNKIQSAISP